jgi:aminotransferase in exopolysaccharide biosynthesis
MKDFSAVIEFIRDTFRTSEAFIPLHEPRFAGNEKKYLEECIDSTFVSSVGKFVDRFEEMVTDFTGTSKAVVCVNGTNALHLALQLSNVKPDDEVITQPLTFIATANAISYCGASPVFVDVDRDTLGLSPRKLEEWLEENVEMKDGKFDNEAQAYNKLTGRRIAACVPMHTFGHPCRIDAIIEICNRYNIKVVEDAAESLGSYYKNQHTGTFAEIGVLSFNGNKTITTGGGGMLLFKDKILGEYAKHLTTQAKMPHKWEFRHDNIGYNYRMPNINAAIGCAQMEQLSNFLQAKRKLANAYDSFFSEKDLSFVKEPSNSYSNYWLNAILLNSREERELFLKQTNESGIMTRPVWELMNTLTMFRDCQKGDLSNAEWLADRLVNIPSSVVR